MHRDFFEKVAEDAIPGVNGKTDREQRVRLTADRLRAGVNDDIANGWDWAKNWHLYLAEVMIGQHDYDQLQTVARALKHVIATEKPIVPHYDKLQTVVRAIENIIVNEK